MKLFKKKKYTDGNRKIYFLGLKIFSYKKESKPKIYSREFCNNIVCPTCYIARPDLLKLGNYVFIGDFGRIYNEMGGGIHWKLYSNR